MATGTPPPPWRVVGQREEYRPGPTGAYVSGVVVQYQLPEGTTGSVFVPDSQYTPDVVRAMVDARAAVMAQIHVLEGDAFANLESRLARARGSFPPRSGQ